MPRGPPPQHRVDLSGEAAPLHPALRFYPVHERDRDTRVMTRTEFVSTVFGCDKMDPLAAASDDMPPGAAGASPGARFPWALPEDAVRRVLEPFMDEDHICVVEVGSHVGASTTLFGRVLRAHSKESYIVCVDTWLHDTSEYILRRQNLPVVLGLANSAQLFHDFLTTVIANRLQATAVPLRLPSVDAARVMFFHGAKAHVVFVDASHEEFDSRLDIELYWQVLVDGGIMLGSNYQIEGVRWAVDAFARRASRRVETRALRPQNGVDQTMWMLIR
jgi:hypothetical protein